jgi:hypothetical protein
MQLFSVNNFQSQTPVRPINSPRSLEGCLRAGLDPNDLLPKPKESFKTPGLTDKMLDIKFETYERKRNESILLVKKERDAIIAYSERKQNLNASGSHTMGGTGGEPTNKKSAMVEVEEKRMEALRQRQKQEMNKLIEKEKTMVLLQQKIAHTEAEEAKKKKIHEKKVAEQKAAAARKTAQIAEELAKKEQDEAEARRQLDRREQAMTKKLNIERAKNEKRILKEARQRDIERAQKAEAHRKHTEALLDAQFKVAEENRQKMVERERRVQEQLAKKKQDKADEIAQMREEATKRMEEAMHKHEEVQEKKKKAFHESEMKAAERAKEHEKEKMDALKKQAADRDARNRLRFQRLVDAYRNRKAKREDIVQRRNKKEGIFGKLQRERDEHIAMLKFTTDLMMADKQENVERVARVNEFRRLQMLAKIEAEDQRWEDIKAEKRRMYLKHTEEVKSTLTRKHEVANAMETMRATNDFSLLDSLFAGKKKQETNDDDDKAKTH